MLELRSRYKLPAYMYKRHFDYGDTVTGLGVDKYGRPKKMRYAHSPEFDEIAVLVGDFRSYDDPKAQETLELIKYAWPEALRISPAELTAQRLGLWREIQRRLSPRPDVKKKGPMRAAFITRNPLLPEEYFHADEVDWEIIDLNRGLQYSLLDCPGQYSVRVATFRGYVTWNLNEIERAKRQSQWPLSDSDSKLAEAARKAAQLTFALRRRGVEAYQFHDRHESIVTIGSFDSVGTPRPDGKIEINPAILEIMQTYGGQVQNLPGLPGAMTARTLEGLPFDVQPLPVKVPKPTLARRLSAAKR